MRWDITRYVVEKIQVEAETKEEALEKAENPHSIVVIKETIRKAK